MTNDPDADLAPLLAKAGILMFEYDVDGFLVRAIGSCLGGADPELEVRSGLASPDQVRRALGGTPLLDHIRMGRRTIAVRHQPVRDAAGRVERVVVTAFDVTHLAPTAGEPVTPWLASIAAAS